MSDYKIILKDEKSTVVSHYTPILKTETKYQSEAELESKFIKDLQELGYEYLQIHNEDDLIANLRAQLEILNDYKFSDSEWEQFFREVFANKNENETTKTEKIQKDFIQILKRDDGSTKNIKLIEKTEIYKNKLQVINQYETDKGRFTNRYDVSILVNGIPLIHCELKRRGVAIKEAFNQIQRYKRDSFWAGCGLYEFIQIFIITNGTHTKYYSNTTRKNALLNPTQKDGKKSRSFEFTSFWADGDNKIIPDLEDFTQTFFARHTILAILTRYCVFTESKDLMIMRPYQIAASERILNKIEKSINYKTLGSIEAGGFIWHTTGSGKTLTSFKTAQLASRLESVEKVIFVVDRKDLDYQTMKEYDKFEKGSANATKNTNELKSNLENSKNKIVVTTIQKLSQFIKKYKNHEIYAKHCVLIFDECHRSQFGQMHKDIISNFKKYNIFGFTGTPIFALNSLDNTKNLSIKNLKTTEQTFGEKLHTYTILNAIEDGNVLPFNVEFVNTIKSKNEIKDEQVKNIDIQKALSDERRISLIVRYILENYERKTKGFFNSILAVSSIEMAKKYYMEFKKQLDLVDENKRLKVATIFSYGANEECDEMGNFGDENSDSAENLDMSSREFLELAIADYNKFFSSNFDSSAEKFGLYYKDLSLKVKERKIDILIVVNMFLTGFDAPELNTLWVDKNLKYHGLIQAFSRTNRILNGVKTYGQICCFRDLSDDTDKAVALFSDKEAKGVVLLRGFDDYYFGYKDENGKEITGYVDLIDELKNKFPLGNEIISDDDKKAFVKLFGAILKCKNILEAFDEFIGKEILSEREFQDYTSIYIDLKNEFKSIENDEKKDITEDIIFEIDLIENISQLYNVDYILKLIEKYFGTNCEDKEIRAKIDSAINASEKLRSKKDLIEAFIASINANSDISEESFAEFMRSEKEKELNLAIQEENLNPNLTKKYMGDFFEKGEITDLGTWLNDIMEQKISIFDDIFVIKSKIFEKLQKIFDRFKDYA